MTETDNETDGTATVGDQICSAAGQGAPPRLGFARGRDVRSRHVGLGRRPAAMLNLLFPLLLFLVSVNASAFDLDAGPLYNRFPLLAEPGDRIEAVGPFLQYEAGEGRKTWAIPPLLSRNWDTVADFNEVDFVYPVITYQRFGPEYRLQFLQLLAFNGGADQEDNVRRRFTLFPLYFQQRSPLPEENYTALFPVYGHLKNRLFRDEISFVLFPLYSRTRRREVITVNYLYPIFSRRHGGSVQGWKIWPITGHEHKAVTTRTNRFGDVEVVGGRDSRFVLWPFYLRQDSGIGTENPVKQRALLPFFSTLRSAQLDSTTVLWPFITHVTDREKGYRAWETPWPLVVFARGQGKNTTRVWPFYSHAQITNAETGFFLWPVYRYRHVTADPLELNRTHILFFLYSQRSEKNTETGAYRTRTHIWPLLARSRDLSGASRLQVFALLEPFLSSSPSIERNYSPLWSVWVSKSDPRTESASQSLLWNLYRRQTSAQSAKTSALFGLFQYQSDPDGKRLRLFYVPVLKTRKAATDQSR